MGESSEASRIRAIILTALVVVSMIVSSAPLGVASAAVDDGPAEPGDSSVSPHHSLDSQPVRNSESTDRDSSSRSDTTGTADIDVRSDTAAKANAQSDTLIVDPDDPDAYDTIQAAVDAATDGQRIEVRDGEYEGTVTLNKNVTLVATGSVTLSGSANGSSSVIEVPAGSNAAPTVDGFRITEADIGFRANDTASAWTVRNTTFVTGVFAINAKRSKGGGRFVTHR